MSRGNIIYRVKGKVLYPLRFAKARPGSMVISYAGIPKMLVFMRVEDSPKDKNKTSHL